MTATPIDGQISAFELMGERPDRITQPEIDRCLCVGSRSGSGRRITDFFSREPDWGRRADFLKEEYGTGGRYPAFPLEDRENEISMDYGAPGIRLRYLEGRERKETRLTWLKAARIVSRLIERGALIADEEDDDE